MTPRHFELLEEARRLLPDFKAELSGDVIIMQASPSTIHQRNLLLVRRQFDAHSSDWLPSENTDLVSPAVEKVRNPDLTYLPDEVMTSPKGGVSADLALIAVEIVSPSNPDNDWHGKVRDYPLMGIPLYLIVDPSQKTVTLFSEPEDGRYRLREDADFGQSIHVPAPFSFTLDTSALLPY